MKDEINLKINTKEPLKIDNYITISNCGFNGEYFFLTFDGDVWYHTTISKQSAKTIAYYLLASIGEFPSGNIELSKEAINLIKEQMDKVPLVFSPNQ